MAKNRTLMIKNRGLFWAIIIGAVIIAVPHGYEYSDMRRKRVKKADIYSSIVTTMAMNNPKEFMFRTDYGDQFRIPQVVEALNKYLPGMDDDVRAEIIRRWIVHNDRIAEKYREKINQN